MVKHAHFKFKKMKIPFLTQREKSCIRFWNTKQNSDVIRTSFNRKLYLIIKKTRHEQTNIGNILQRSQRSDEKI